MQHTRAAGASTDRVWTLHELELLNEVQKPIAVIVSAVFEDPHSASGLKDVVRVLFTNSECTKKYGLPRPPGDTSRLIGEVSEEHRQKRRVWLANIAQGKNGQQSWMDAHAMLLPIFSGVNKDAPSRLVRVDSKPIRIQTADRVENAILHVVESETASSSDIRVSAMHDHSPIHSMLFNNQGTLLTANKAALKALQVTFAGPWMPDTGNLTLKTLFDVGTYPGGEAEAQAAYDEAVNAVFNLQLECHRHAQPHKSKKDGKTKWAMIEMWPIIDPVSLCPSALVKRYNISQQKELELQLAVQQDILQRHNQELEQDAVVTNEEKRQLQLEADSLAQRLEAVMHDKFQPRAGFDADTPIDKTLNFLQSCIGGDMPPVQTALDLYHILSESDTNLRQPVALENQLLQTSMGSEVGQSMLQLLQGNNYAQQTPVVAQGPVCLLERRSPASQAAAALEGHAHSSRQLQRRVSQVPGLSRTTSADPSIFVPMSVTPEVERFLQDAENNWQFDIFGFAQATPGTTLSMLAFHLMKQCGMMQLLQMNEAKLIRFLQKVESGYDPANAYHNSIHVASVVQMTHMILCHGGLMKIGAISPMQQAASLWSALVHDYEHGGLNNDFLIKTSHPLAITYNDQSPLENHHMAAASRLLRMSDYQYLSVQTMTMENTSQLRSVSANQVLGTDMKKHFDITSRFQAAFKRPGATAASEGSGATAVEDWDAVKAEDKTLVYQMVLKCADIGHLAASPRTHRRWAYQLEEEFFRQGDQERDVGLPVSPLMDRSHKGGMTRSQLGFFSIVGIPLFKALADLFPGTQPILDGVLENYHHWEDATDEAKLPA